MLLTDGDFNKEIREDGRYVGTQLIFKDFVVGDSHIVSLSYNSQGKKELGGLVRDVVNLTLIDEGELANIKIGDGYYLKFYTQNGSCMVGIFYISRIKRNDRRKEVEIESVDILEHMRNNGNRPLPLLRNVTTHDYMRKIGEALGLSVSIENGVFSQNLSIAYPTGTSFADTLESLAFATQSIIRFKPTYSTTLRTIIPFTLGKKVFFDDVFFNLNDLLYFEKSYIDVKSFKTKQQENDIIEYVNMLLDFKVDDDNTNVYRDVNVSLFFPTLSDARRVADVKLTIPASMQSYTTGKIGYTKGTVPTLLSFNGNVDITDFAIFDDGCKLTLNNNDLLTKQHTLEINGYSLQESSITDDTDNQNIKTIVNQYIQSPTPYDLRVYKGKSCTIDYRGNPAYEVGDTLLVDGKKVLVTEHSLEYTGGLKGVLKGVIVDG